MRRSRGALGSSRSRPRARGSERVVPYALVAAGLAAAGLAASVWRPLAPPLEMVSTDLDSFDAALLATVEAYRAPRRVGATVSLLIGVAVPLAALLTRRGRSVVRRLAGRSPRSTVRAAVVAIAVVAAIDLARVPVTVAFAYYQDGVYGFRTSTALGFARDWLLAAGYRWLLAGVAGAMLVAFAGRWPRSWHWRLVPIATALLAVLVLVQPVVFDPLWLRTEPLPAGPVRDEVEPVVERAGLGEVDILVGDASRRTTKVNAYVTGLGPSRRVVLYDTLVRLPPQEVAAVVAHELAHREHGDIPRNILLFAAGLLPVAWAVRQAWNSGWARRALQAQGPADPRLVVTALAVLAIAEVALLPAGNLFSRRAEAAADHRGLELSGNPATLVRLTRGYTVRDLGDPDPPRWTVVLWGTHPSVSQRVRAAVAHAQRADLPLPTLDELAAVEDGYRHPRAGHDP